MQAAAQEAGFDEPRWPARASPRWRSSSACSQTPTSARRSLFYFREPLPYDQMAPATAASYSEAHTGEPGAAAAQARRRLKARIEAELPERGCAATRPTGTPSTSASPASRPGAGRCSKTSGATWTRDPRAYAAPRSRTWQEQERWALEQFVEDRGRDFVGREATLARLRRSPSRRPGREAPPGAPASPAPPAPARAPCRSPQPPPPARRAGPAAPRPRRRHQPALDPGGRPAAALDRTSSRRRSASLQDPTDEATSRTSSSRPSPPCSGARHRAARRAACSTPSISSSPPPAPSTSPGCRSSGRPTPASSPPPSRARPEHRAGPTPRRHRPRPAAARRPGGRADRRRASAGATTRPCPHRAGTASPTRPAPTASPPPALPLWLELALDSLTAARRRRLRPRRSLPGASTGERLRRPAARCRRAPATRHRRPLRPAARARRADPRQAWAQAFVDLTALSRGGWREADLQALLPN